MKNLLFIIIGIVFITSCDTNDTTDITDPTDPNTQTWESNWSCTDSSLYWGERTYESFIPNPDGKDTLEIFGIYAFDQSYKVKAVIYDDVLWVIPDQVLSQYLIKSGEGTISNNLIELEMNIDKPSQGGFHDVVKFKFIPQ